MRRKLSVANTLKYTLPIVAGTVGMLNHSGQGMDEAVSDESDSHPETGNGTRITLSFAPEEMTTTWDWSDLDYTNSNEAPNRNLTVMSLILASSIEMTVGRHAWSLVEKNLRKIGFTNIVHHYFERAEKISRAAMVFGRSIEPVNGKYVVAAIYRGSSSIEDAISDAKSELDGFYEAGMAGAGMLKSYITSQGLTKENTTLFITGHSYGASNASLVGILSTDLAERDSIFCYPFATPNYNRHGLTGDGMKMFSFDSNEDVVPQVPVGPNLDKTGVDIKYDRLDIQLNDPERYQRFLRLYKYFRGKDFEEDSDFLPDEYSGNRGLVKIHSKSLIVRNHMPYTYMALILSEQPDEVIDTYIGSSAVNGMEIEMYEGEVYKLPGAGTGDGIVWKSTDESVAAINDKGMLEGKKAGSAQLIAESENGESAVVDVTVLAD